MRQLKKNTTKGPDLFTLLGQPPPTSKLKMAVFQMAQEGGKGRGIPKASKILKIFKIFKIPGHLEALEVLKILEIPEVL